MSLLLWLLIADGVTTIVTQSILFRPLREMFVSDEVQKILQGPNPDTSSLGFWRQAGVWIAKLLHCPMCFGFWVGLLLGVLSALWGGWPEGLPLSWPTWLRVWALGALASSICWTTHLVRSKLNETLGL